MQVKLPVTAETESRATETARRRANRARRAAYWSRRLKPLATLLLAGCASLSLAKPLQVHDPVLAKDGEHYYVFSTGPGITIYQSADMLNWRRTGRVFATEPDWAQQVAPGFDGHLWAPDIIEKDGRFYLFYSVSAFGKNTSGMGVAVNNTLDPTAADYQWQDLGMLLQSVPNRDNWNAIDPAVIKDQQGRYWMSFGSFWDGLKLVQLDPSLSKLAEPQQWHSIAKRQRYPTLTPVMAPLKRRLSFTKTATTTCLCLLINAAVVWTAITKLWSAAAKTLPGLIWIKTVTVCSMAAALWCCRVTKTG